MSGGGNKQGGGGAPQQSIPLPSGPRPDMLAGQTGMGRDLNPTQKPPDMSDIKSILANLSGSQQMADPSHAVIGGFQNKPISPPSADVGMPDIAKTVAANGMGSAPTAGLGAGDAAAQAAQASGAMLPGAASAGAVAGMQSQMSEQLRQSIQQKMDLAKMLMGG
jgi:hypothetical protein